MWLRDTGIMNKMNDDILAPPIPTEYPKARNKQPLSIRQLGIVLILLLGGIILSIIVFILELLKSKDGKGNLPAESIELKGVNAIRKSSSSELTPSNQLQLHSTHGKTTVTNHK